MKMMTTTRRMSGNAKKSTLASTPVMLLLLALLVFSHTLQAISLPSHDGNDNGLAVSSPALSLRSALLLEKRKGGGGGRGGGGSSGGGRGSSGSSGSRPGNTLGTSNAGGSSSRGSGVQPSYGGSGRGVYAGGTSSPYSAGLRSPIGGIAPTLLVVGALVWWTGPLRWGNAGVYQYRYPGTVTYFNQTSGQNMTVPAVCLCQRYLECSCEAVQEQSGATNQSAYVESLIGNGSYATMQSKQQLVQLARINGVETLAINGTLANGTTAANGATAAGGRGAMLGWTAIGSAFGLSLFLI